MKKNIKFDENILYSYLFLSCNIFYLLIFLFLIMLPFLFFLVLLDDILDTSVLLDIVYNYLYDIYKLPSFLDLSHNKLETNFIDINYIIYLDKYITYLFKNSFEIKFNNIAWTSFFNNYEALKLNVNKIWNIFAFTPSPSNKVPTSNWTFPGTNINPQDPDATKKLTIWYRWNNDPSKNSLIFLINFTEQGARIWKKMLPFINDDKSWLKAQKVMAKLWTDFNNQVSMESEVNKAKYEYFEMWMEQSELKYSIEGTIPPHFTLDEFKFFVTFKAREHVWKHPLFPELPEFRWRSWCIRNVRVIPYKESFELEIPIREYRLFGYQEYDQSFFKKYLKWLKILKKQKKDNKIELAEINEYRRRIHDSSYPQSFQKNFNKLLFEKKIRFLKLPIFDVNWPDPEFSLAPTYKRLYMILKKRMNYLYKESILYFCDWFDHLINPISEKAWDAFEEYIDWYDQTFDMESIFFPWGKEMHRIRYKEFKTTYFSYKIWIEPLKWRSEGRKKNWFINLMQFKQNRLILEKWGSYISLTNEKQ